MQLSVTEQIFIFHQQQNRRPSKVSKLRGMNVWAKVDYPSPTHTIQEKIAVYEQAKAECKSLMATEKDEVELNLLNEDYKWIKSMLYLYRKGKEANQS